MYATILSPAEGSTFHHGDSITVTIALHNAGKKHYGYPLALYLNNFPGAYYRNLIKELTVSKDTIYHTGFVVTPGMPDTAILYAKAGYTLGSQTNSYAPLTTIYIQP